MALKNYIDAAKIEQDIAYTDNDLDTALMNQSSLNLYYGMQMAKAQHQVDTCKNRLEIISAEVNEEMRQCAIDKGEKVTEKRLETEVLLNERVQEASADHNKAKLILNLAKVALDSMNQRHQMLIQSCKRAEQELMIKGEWRGSNATERAAAFLEKKQA